jgi:hypothetical protein
MIALHADWSMHAAKRYHALARQRDNIWHIAAPRLVGEPMALLRPLLSEGAPVFMGLDLPLGLPRAYAAHCAEADFPAFASETGHALLSATRDGDDFRFVLRRRADG